MAAHYELKKNPYKGNEDYLDEDSQENSAFYYSDLCIVITHNYDIEKEDVIEARRIFGNYPIIIKNQNPFII